MLRPIDEANERLHLGGSVDPLRYTPAPMIDFIDGDEQSDFLRQEEVCGLDIARQDQRSWN